jgi:Gluconate 2-dehydrogenase subunit 3
MSNKKTISRRTALKVIAVGVGATNTLPILENTVLGQQRHPGMDMGQAPGGPSQNLEAPRFFNPQELATISVVSDLIIPADEHSPGAKAGGVPVFIDLMVSESPYEVKALWRDGLAAVERMSQQKFSIAFTSAPVEQQVSLLKAISKNERKPKTIEERFFVAIKSLTVDGYYTSQIGIHQELHYKGNAYLKDFVGCTHPEHST